MYRLITCFNLSVSKLMLLIHILRVFYKGVLMVARKKKAKLSKKQWVTKNRLDLMLEYNLSHKVHVYWVTLTSVPGSPDIVKSYQKLVRKIEARSGQQLESCAIETSEGHGVLHCFWCIGGKGLPNAREWLYDTWGAIHGARRVNIQTIKGGANRTDAQKISMYAVTQYAADQGTHFVKARWSRFTYMPVRVNKFLPMVRKFLKDEFFYWSPWMLSYRLTLDCCRLFLRGDAFRYKDRAFIFIDGGIVPL